MVRVSPLTLKLCGSRVHSRSSILTFPSLFMASLTPSTNELSDVVVHDAMIRLRNVAKNAVERFMIVYLLFNANISIRASKSNQANLTLLLSTFYDVCWRHSYVIHIFVKVYKHFRQCQSKSKENSRLPVIFAHM